MRNRKKDGPYVAGPYLETRGRYRLKVWDGIRLSKPSFETEKEALKEKSRLERKFNPEEVLTVDRLIERYLAYQREVKGNRTWSYENCGLRLRQFFRDHLGLSVSRLTPEKAEETYHGHVARKHFRTGNRLSDATQQGDCKKARAMFRWATKRGLVPLNPFGQIELVGKPKRGKKQLTADEGERFVKAGIERFVRCGDRLALAAVVCITTGGRTNEVLKRIGADLDEGGTVLVVRERDASEHAGEATVKNATSKRRLFLHPQIQPLVAKLAAERPAGALLFTEVGFKAESQKLRRKVHEICAAASVPQVTTHSLRGWYATTVYQRSLDPSQTAAMLGHSDFGMTERCYLDPSAAARARVKHIGNLLGLADPEARAREILAELDEPTLASLVRLLPQKVPGLQVFHPSRLVPNQSPGASLSEISVGEL
ncbi:MAG: tyrosine-type recombinase/integrase [Polyangia bacterium]